MKKNIDRFTDLLLGCIVIIFLSALFYLTQRNYSMLKKSDFAVIQTSNVIREQQKISTDFKDAIIYISTIKNNGPREYADTYGAGLWQISIDLQHLKQLLDKQSQQQLDSLSKEIDKQVTWMQENAKSAMPDTARNQHIKAVSLIQNYFDNKIAELEKHSITDVKEAESSLVRLHDWIVILIVVSSLMIAIMLILISKQFRRVKIQNSQLMEIAWLQSHKVRAQVANLLGLSQLFNMDNLADPENGQVVTNMFATANNLDEVVKDINEKTVNI